LARVTRPGGRGAICDLAWPQNRVVRAAFACYLGGVIPACGQWLAPTARRAGRDYERLRPFRYLSASVKALPQPDRVTDMLGAAGWSEVGLRRLALGAVCLYTCRRP